MMMIPEIRLRPFQKRALRILENDVHLVCLSPTGSGKSLIYERHCENTGDKTVLVTPLIALARQQAMKLRLFGMTADSERHRLESQVWIVSPEKLQSLHSKGALRKFSPRFWVVDECHCLWDWGDRFRPAFRSIPLIMKELGVRKSLWLTATLPPPGKEEVLSGLPEPKRILGDFQFPESLDFHVQKAPWNERAFRVLQWVRRAESSGVLFAGTREMAEKYCRLIQASGVDARAYHAGMSKEERVSVERWVSEFKSGFKQVVCATSAFGMGMDYRELEWVILVQPPSSLLALAQAIGRVGRGGRKGAALLYWDEVDLAWLDRVGLSERGFSEFAAVAQFLRKDFTRERPGDTLTEYFNRSLEMVRPDR